MITDYQGSVLGLISTTGTLAATDAYDPYGTKTTTGTAASANAFHYISGWDYGTDYTLGYRWYFPGWGRFRQTDPTGQETNPYTYAHDDPITGTYQGCDWTGAQPDLGSEAFSNAP